MLVTLRRWLAGPFYLLAFIFHLLTAFYFLAEFISGDNFEKRSRKPLLLLIALVPPALLFILAKPTEILTMEQLKIVEPADFRYVHITEKQREQLIPYVKISGCIFAEEAVLYSLRPAKVGFAPCALEGTFDISFSDDLTDVSVSGQAEIDGKQKTFTAKLNHYPIRVSPDGFQAVKIEIGQ